MIIKNTKKALLKIKNSVPTIFNQFKGKVIQRFDGGEITSDGEILPLAKIDQVYEVTTRLA
ncbi:MAG: hypothetical protein PF689_08020, partial [Deltaproteobacteria bacterium]|nr:hypothetical protein [Deltaproteobacteria bacterium]